MIGFRLAGIPVRVQPFFVLLAIFLGLGRVGEASDLVVRMTIWVAIVFSGVLAHELGHAISGRLYGLEPRIELHGFGGLTSFGASGLSLTPTKSIVVSLAGPGVGIAIGALAGLALLVLAPSSTGLLHFTLANAVWVNLGWGVLNLVPMLPLDGGNVMSSFFELVFGPRGTKAARVISLLVALALVGLALAVQNLVMAILLGFFAFANFRALRLELRIGVDKPLLADLVRAEQLLKQGDARGATELATSVATRAQTNAVRADALTLAMLARLSVGDAFGARAALAQVPPGQSVDPGVHGAVLLAAGEAAAAFDVLAKALRDRPGPFVEERFVEATERAGYFERAAELLDSPLGRSVGVGALERLEEAAYRKEAYTAAARFGTTLWDIDRRPSRAYNVACALARAGRSDEAMGWLEEARKAGFDKLEKLDQDRDLAVLRQRSDWGPLRAQFGR
jgi:Zn-dependent protease